jgi:ATP-dependent protease ClpP protease subunit
MSVKLQPISVKADAKLQAAATSTDFKVGVRALDDESVEILVHGVIGDSWEGLDSASVAKFLGENRGKKVNVRINSPGGLAWDGIAIYNELVQHDSRVEVTIEGMAGSAASIIAMAGDHIKIAENGQFFVHRAWALAVGNTTVMLDAAEFLDRLDQAIAATYAARTGRTPAKMLALMEGKVDGTIFTGQEAVDEKFADEVIPLKKRGDRKEEEPADLRNQFKADIQAREREVAVRLTKLKLDDHELAAK